MSLFIPNSQEVFVELIFTKINICDLLLHNSDYLIKKACIIKICI